MHRFRMLPTFLWLPAAMVLFSAGCASMGPNTIARDRLNYEHAITESWQRRG